MKKIRISIVDDHPLMITALKAIVRERPAELEILGAYRGGAPFLEDIRTNLPDVLMLDIQMPGLSGDKIASVVKRRFPSVKIIILSNMDFAYYVKSMIDLGVDGYLFKTAAEEHILDAIFKVANGGKYIEKSVEETVRNAKLVLERHKSGPLLLTKREKEILTLIAADLTSQEMAERLFLSKRTIDALRYSLLLKFNVKTSASLIKIAIDIGVLKGG